MRYVITGGAGFTGSYLCRALLEHNERPLVFDVVSPSGFAPDSVDFVSGNICSADDVSRIALAPDDVVFHMAARQFHAAVPHHNRDDWFAEVNVNGTQNILDAMAKGGASHLVFFSTDMTYGRPLNTPVPVDHPQHPIGPYGRSKRAAEQLLMNARDTHGVAATIFRPRLISGAGRLGILSKLFRLVHAGAPVPMIGSGHNHYQMIAVEDCVSAALRAVECGFPSGPFNLGSEDPPTVHDLLADLIKRAKSHSFLVPTPAALVQRVLRLLDDIGQTLLFPEQFAIADCDYILDTTATTKALDWRPAKRDEDIIYEAFHQFEMAGA